MPSLTITDANNVSLELVINAKIYPHEMRLKLLSSYNESKLTIDGKLEDYFEGFYVLYSTGNIVFNNPSRNKQVNLLIELTKCWVPFNKNSKIAFFSKPLSKEEIVEIDKELRTGDIELNWDIEAYGVLPHQKLTQKNDFELLQIYIGEPARKKISRTNFIENVLEKVDMLKREFIEVTIEQINLQNIQDEQVKNALIQLSEKQKILLEAKDSLAKAKTQSQYRGVIDEVRRVMEGLKKSPELLDLCSKAFREFGKISSPDPEANEEGSNEIASALIGGKDTDRRMAGFLEVTFNLASRLGVHTETLTNKHYTPKPLIEDAEFLIQVTFLELNYLIKLLNNYTQV